MKFVLPLALAAVFALALARLFELRFEQGDIYPPYSSLRADPLGTMALHEALRESGRLEVRRLFEPLGRLESGRDTTLLMLGASPWTDALMPEEGFRELERFMHEGGRIVVAYHPYPVQAWAERLARIRRGEDPDQPATDDADKPRKAPASKPPAKRSREDLRKRKLIALEQRWDVRRQWKNLELDEDGVPVPARAAADSAKEPLPASVSCHTACVFEFKSDDWRVLYRRDGDPVLIERRFGAGSLVFCADAWPFSNQALRQERSTPLLAWLLGGSRRIVFEETHLGVARTEGVATLGRRYGLHGLMAGLIVLALLFIWKNAASLVPPFEEERDAAGEFVGGRDSGSGFINLLRRNIPPAQLPGVCVAEWRKCFGRGGPGARQKLQAAEELLSGDRAKKSQVLPVFRELRQIFQRKL